VVSPCGTITDRDACRTTSSRRSRVGHSERRQDHHETDALIQAKTKAAIGAGLTPIVCVGETEAQRSAGE
jgi:triosephosphate isomerase (TIM)